MSGTKTVSLGGREFSIPPLAIKQNRVVFPLCVKLNDLVKRFAESKGEFTPSPEEFEVLNDVVYIGLTKGSPLFTREAFDEMEVPPLDLLIAFLTIRSQTGAWIVKETTEGETQGTALAQETPPTSTSTS